MERVGVAASTEVPILGVHVLTIVAAVLMIAFVSTQDVPAVTDSHGAFAFPNLAGTELIVLHEIPHASDLRTAICEGRSVSIRLARRQTVDPESEGREPTRDSPRHFDRLTGTVFKVLGRGVRPEDTCFVAADSLLENADLLSVRAFSSAAECTPTDGRRVAAIRERSVRACWLLAAVPPRGTIAVVEYVRVGRDGLFSLIVVANERTIVIDFPAEGRSGDSDMWRVGDGGELSPEALSVPFILRRGDSYFVALEWAGEEGNSLSLFAAKPGRPARRAISDYWYRLAY